MAEFFVLSVHVNFWYGKMQITKYVKLPPPPKKKMYYFQPAITSADWKVVLPQFHQKGLTKPSIWSIPSQCPARFENKAAMQNQSRRGNTHTHTQKKKGTKLSEETNKRYKTWRKHRCNTKISSFSYLNHRVFLQLILYTDISNKVGTRGKINYMFLMPHFNWERWHREVSFKDVWYADCFFF